MKLTINDNLLTIQQANEICNTLFPKDKSTTLKIQATKSLVNSSIFLDDCLTVEYVNLSYLFRSIFLYATKENWNRKVVENSAFERLSIMLDSSRDGVLTLDYLKKVILKLAFMGYTSMQIYTEDTYEVNEEPYFGYLRGRYSKSDMKEIDQYAASYGIEVIPCIQTLAHLERIFSWPTYKNIQDIHDILLVDDERTYQLIGHMLDTVKECFSSHTINIGMDEAFLLGMGKYHEIHGDVCRTKIMLEHLKKVAAMAKERGYDCLMWSDMFYRLAFGSYYDEKCGSFEDKYTTNIPDNVDLIYWDYYSDSESHFESIMNQHKAFHTNTWFAGGAWTYLGFLPDNDFSLRLVKSSVEACQKTGVKNYLMTLWGDNGSECSISLVLPVLLHLAEACYHQTNESNIQIKFERLTNLKEEVFFLPEKIDKVGNITGAEFTDPSKYLFYNDCFAGQFDSLVSISNGSEYKKIAQELKPWMKNKQYGYLFATPYYLAEVMSIKVTLGIDTRNAYQRKDKKALKKLAKKYSQLSNYLKQFYQAFLNGWKMEKKIYGLEIHNYRIGGLIARVEYCRKEILAYCSGKTNQIEILDEAILDYFGKKEHSKCLAYINRFDQIFTVNYL
jgi:hexosaminidase